MATRPTDKLVKWATSSKARKFRPRDTKRARGWQAAILGGAYGEVPPYEWFNYMMYSYGEWLDYLTKFVETLPSSKPVLTIMKCSMARVSSPYKYPMYTLEAANLNERYNLEFDESQSLLRKETSSYLTSNQSGFLLDSDNTTFIIRKNGMLKVQSYSYSPSTVANPFDVIERFKVTQKKQYEFGSVAHIYYGLRAIISFPPRYNSQQRFDNFNLVYNSLLDYTSSGSRPELNNMLEVDIVLNSSAGESLCFPVQEDFKVTFHAMCVYAFTGEFDRYGNQMGSISAAIQPLPPPNFYKHLIISHID